MKKILLALGLVAICVVCSSARSFDDSDPQGVSLKAGPTDASESVSIAWIETALYPKNIQGGRDVFVEVKVTSKMRKVAVLFDFDLSNEKAELYSDDGLSWSRVFKTPENAATGVHVAKVIIESKNGKTISRTLDFVILENARSMASVPTYDVSVVKSAPVMENGETIRQLLPGIKVTALYKAPFYRIKLADGAEGWVESSKVKEPTEEFYLLGYRSYKAKQYEEAKSFYLQTIALDPFHTSAHYWLAKTYIKLGEENNAVVELREVLKQNANYEGAKDLASSLSQDSYNRSVVFLAKGDFKNAVAGFKKSIQLVPTMLTAWIKLGETYNKMGATGDAKMAFWEALRIDPENRDARFLLGVSGSTTKVEMAKTSKPTPQVASADFVKDSIAMVEQSKTSKGTFVASAVKSVLALTRSLGTKVKEEGWHVQAVADGFMVRYACRQERNGKPEVETFDWKINPDNKTVLAVNDNSKLLMNRW